METISTTIVTPTKFYCEKCDVYLSRADSYRNHLKTAKHNMTKGEYREKLQQIGRDAIINGDNNENYVLEILKTLNFEEVIFQGFTSNKYDIFIKFHDETHYRGLQVKTLIYYPERNTYVINPNRSGYEADTLIIAVDNAKTKAVLLFYSEMLGKKKYNISRTHNADKIIENFDLFKLRLVEYARRSSMVIEINDSLYESQRQEADSVNRFRIICESLNIPFRQNSTNTNEIDAIANEHNIQFKSSSSKKIHTYNFGLSRRTNGIKRPYNIDDNVDFFIFEIVVEGYKNGFYIIPKKVLIDEGYISNVNNTGKFGIEIAPYDYGKYHWTLQFLHKFDQLIFSTAIMVIRNRLHKICIDMGFSCEFNKMGKLISINSYKVRHVKHTTYNINSCSFGLSIQVNKIREPIHINDGYDFLIFDYGDSYPNQFCVIPAAILVQCGIISTESNKGKIQWSIPFIGKSPNAWTNYYMNNFNLLRPIKLVLSV